MTVHRELLRWTMGLLFACSITCHQPNCLGQGQDSERVRGVLVTDQVRFPPAWLESPIEASAEPLENGFRQLSIDVVKRALAKYPKAVLDGNLRAVYLVGTLQFSGVSASGTNSRDAIYLANRGPREGFTSEWLERVFHSEFSSILLRNHRANFPEKLWNTANPTGFSYGESGVEAIRSKLTGRLFDEEFLKDGFVGAYATSTMENDFNAIAGQLLLGNNAIWSAARRHQRLAAKVDLTIAFYETLDPKLTRDSFKRLALEGAVAN